MCSCAPKFQSRMRNGRILLVLKSHNADYVTDHFQNKYIVAEMERRRGEKVVMVDEQTIGGKYLKKEASEKKQSPLKTRPIILAVSIIVICILLICMAHDHSAYQKIVHNGYIGTQEQWLASLVGEEADTGDADTAYQLAVKNGYRGTESEWIETLIGVEVDDLTGSPYMLACENGFEGSLAEWLTEIADKPEKLGKSDNEGPKTEYELACEYGYSGTFIEWLVSVTHDRVFEQEENT